MLPTLLFFCGSMTTVIDGKDHLLGRLASVVAKELLNGKKIVVCHCEGINISGTHHNTKERYLKYFQKRCNYNRKRGQFHFRAPEMLFAKTVRRMLPMRTWRGRQAYDRLQCFAGVPESHRTGHVVVPEAMRQLRLRETSKYCVLGEVAAEIGWKRQADVALFDKRHAEADQKRRADYQAAYEKACKNADVAKLTEELKKYGYGY